MALILGLETSCDETAVALAEKPRIAAANKVDAMADKKALEKLRKHLKKIGVPLYPISAATGEGLPALLEAMWKEVGPMMPPPSEQETVRQRPSEADPSIDNPGDDGDGAA